jgi:hypothetical protein
MGHYADRYPGKTSRLYQTFYLNTGDKSNFARKFPFYLIFTLALLLGRHGWGRV